MSIWTVRSIVTFRLWPPSIPKMNRCRWFSVDQEHDLAATLIEKPCLGSVGKAALMLDDLATPGIALAFALAFVFAAGSFGVWRTRHSSDQRAGLCIILLVLTLTMAMGVVVFRPLQAGDLIVEREHR